MKRTLFALTVALFLLAAPAVRADDPGFNQLVNIQAGPFRPDAVGFSNGSYQFNYNPDSLGSFLVEAGWSAQLFRLAGSVSLEENLAYTRFSASSDTVSTAPVTGQSISVDLLGFDTRIMYSVDSFPWRRLIPFVDGGYQYTLYYQSGASDLSSAQGGVGNFVVGGGLRFWINRDSSLSDDHVNRMSNTPLFITAKVNRIFPSDGTLNLASTTCLGGISLGL